MARLKLLGVIFEILKQALMVGQIGHGGIVENLVLDMLLNRIIRILVHLGQLVK